MVSHWSSTYPVHQEFAFLPVYQEVACLVLGQLVPRTPVYQGLPFSLSIRKWLA